IAAIRTNYANFYGVEELAEHLGISKCHLVRSFKAATGTTPGQYLTAVRIEAAKQLLGTEDCSLDLVAQLSGFADANYFCKVFRAKTGFSPAVYRKSVQGNNTVLDLVSHSIYL
ncbi:MAG: AraC family transcriptional regulator, partial [Pygmaiobacter sp.]